MYVKRTVDLNMDWWIGYAVGASELFIHSVAFTFKRYSCFSVFMFLVTLCVYN